MAGYAFGGLVTTMEEKGHGQARRVDADRAIPMDVRPLSYSRPHQAGTTTPMAASRASRGSASSKPSIIGVSVLALFSDINQLNGRRVSVHWFAGVLQSLCSPSKWRAAKGWATHLSREPPLREAGSRFPIRGRSLIQGFAVW